MSAVRRNRAGLTLVETMLAVVLAGIAGAAACGVLWTVSGVQDDVQGYAGSVAAGRIGLSRLTEEMSKARLIVAADANRVALWSGDYWNAGQPDSPELTLLEYKPAEDRVYRTRVVFPDTINPMIVGMLYRPLELYEMRNPSQVFSLIYVTGYGETDVIAESVTALSLQYDEQPPMTRRVTLQAKFGADPAVTMNATVALRCPAADYVTWVDHLPYLQIPDVTGDLPAKQDEQGMKNLFDCFRNDPGVDMAETGGG